MIEGNVGFSKKAKIKRANKKVAIKLKHEIKPIYRTIVSIAFFKRVFERLKLSEKIGKQFVREEYEAYCETGLQGCCGPALVKSPQPLSFVDYLCAVSHRLVPDHVAHRGFAEPLHLKLFVFS